MAKKRLVIGNWKMYIERPEEARALSLLLRRKLRGISGVDVSIAPPFTMLADISRVFESSPVQVGAQAISQNHDGGHTGEISGLMLKGAGASFVIIGHSERRAAGDTDAAVRQQLAHTVTAGLMPVLCVGEKSRGPQGADESDAHDHFSFVEEQLSTALRNVPKNLLKKLIVAYEPVWAIGKSASGALPPGEVREMSIFIRKTLAGLVGREQALKTPILYGGSVEPDNIAPLVAEGGVSGFLVGRASAHADSFLAIIEACK